MDDIVGRHIVVSAGERRMDVQVVIKLQDPTPSSWRIPPRAEAVLGEEYGNSSSCAFFTVSS